MVLIGLGQGIYVRDFCVFDTNNFTDDFFKKKKSNLFIYVHKCRAGTAWYQSGDWNLGFGFGISVLHLYECVFLEAVLQDKCL